MAELTADQQAQANQLHGAVAWVYPELSDTAFWDNYFNPQPTLTADEQSSGIQSARLTRATTRGLCATERTTTRSLLRIRALVAVILVSALLWW